MALRKDGAFEKGLLKTDFADLGSVWFASELRQELGQS